MRFGMPAKRIKRAHSPTYSISPYVAWSPRSSARGAALAPSPTAAATRFIDPLRTDQSQRSAPSGGIPSVAKVSGDRVEVTWTVGESDVGEKRAVQFTLAHAGRFHRHSPWDDGALFYFHVNPPRDD